MGGWGQVGDLAGPPTGTGLTRYSVVRRILSVPTEWTIVPSGRK